MEGEKEESMFEIDVSFRMFLCVCICKCVSKLVYVWVRLRRDFVNKVVLM